MGVGVLVGKVGKGDGVTDGLRVLNGMGVAEGSSAGGVQVGANGGSVAVGVVVGSSTAGTNVGNSCSGAKAAGRASVGRTQSSCKNASSGNCSGATKKITASAAMPKAMSSSRAAATLINLPIHPVCFFCLVAMLVWCLRTAACFYQANNVGRLPQLIQPGFKGLLQQNGAYACV